MSTNKSTTTWNCKCGSKGRTLEHADPATGLNMAVSLGYYHFVQHPGKNHEVTVAVDGEVLDLKTASARALGIEDFTAPDAVVQVIARDQNAPLIQVASARPEGSTAGLKPYHAHNGEVEDLCDAIRHEMNGLLIGPTGCGKTHLAQWCIRKVGQEMTTIQGTEGATYEDLVGYRTVENGSLKWVDGLILKAMRAGHVLYVDEPNALPDGIRFALFSAMDHRREMTLAQNDGEVVKAAPGFTVLAAMNEGTGYGGTTLLNQAFRARFDMVLVLDYLDEKEEAKLLVERTGIGKPLAKKMVEVASKLRVAQKGRQVRTPVSTRSLIAWGRFVAAGKDPQKAAELTIIGQVPTTDSTERKTFQDTVEAVLGSSVEAVKV